MEAARPRKRGRRLRRGTVDRPLNTRLVRMGFLVVAPALVALLFSISQTGTLPQSPLEPLFDARAAAAHATTLATIYPARVPGTVEAEEAARWYRETMASLGLETEEDVWTEDVAGLGDIELRNVVTVIPGRSSQTIVVVAHRDNVGTGQPQGDNASGTGALLELARGFAPQDVGPGPLPERTLVLVSTDAGAYGGAGAARFAEESQLAADALAVVVLDGIGRSRRPRLAIAGDEPVTPARALVRTAAARIREQTGVEPELPSLPAQLVGLGLPFAAEEQGRFLARELAAVTITTDPRGERTGGVTVATRRLGQLGRATEALVGSLDVSVGRAFRTPDSLFLGDRAASGWTVRLTLVLLVVPFALGAVDLVVRGARRGLPFAGALRALRARVLVWLSAGILLWLGALVGIFPTGAPLPPPPFTDLVDDVPAAGLLLLVLVFAILWVLARRRLAPGSGASATAEERLAGLVAALGLVGAVAVVLALATPYALVFVLPSLYAWLWMPLEGRPWHRVALFAVGLVGPVFAGFSLARQLALPLSDVPLYLASLATVGYLAPASVVLALLWAAAAAQVGALSFGRYAPYAARTAAPSGMLRRTGTALRHRRNRSRRA